MRTFRRKLVLSTIATALLAGGILGGRKLYISRPAYGLPYNARFTPDEEDRWGALGGSWEVADGAMRNDSNDRGAKLLTGLPNWKDYQVEGDVQLQGEGSAGMLARVTDAEIGENSFKGYYAGVRTVDNSLNLGAFDFAYHEVAKVTLTESVKLFRWYHVRLKADGCQITASVRADGMSEVKTRPLNDPDCFRSGAVGLRSNGTGGVWRNVVVSPISSVVASANSKVQTLPASSTTALQRPKPVAEGLPSNPTQSIISLLYLPPFGNPAAVIRGTVVLTRPMVYVQDSTGGVEVQANSIPTLKIGDEVEVAGEVDVGKSNPVIRRASFYLVREGVPISPVVITANQAAEGNFDGRFVQVEGFLRAIAEGKDGALTLDLDSGTQSFRAILPPGRSRSHLQHIAIESRLRLRGISVIDPRFKMNSDPFVILVRSTEDVDVVAGPPWWRPSTLIFAGLVLLGLIFAFNYLYLFAKHWRLRAVADERERLAHEIHDTLAQSFAGIGFQLQAIRNSLPVGSKSLVGQVDLAMLMTRTSHEEARRSIASLRPESLGSIGLLPALRECAERMVKNGNVKVETFGEDGGRGLPPRIKDTLFRIGQEAIANSIRHAQPGTIRITFHRTRSSICLSVEDDGEGFVADSDRAGFGLLGMRRRAESISATLIVKSTPSSGTSVEVKAVAGSPFLRWPWWRPTAFH